MNDSGAVGVHEWCEIRLIRTQGQLACARNQVGFGIRGRLFGYFLERQKVTRKMIIFFLGVAPQTRDTFCLETKSTPKNSRLMRFLLQVTLVVCHAIQAISLRFISGLLPKPNANTTALNCYAKISCAE